MPSHPFLFSLTQCIKQCNMKRAEIKSGDRFGMLTIIEEVDPHVTPCGTIRRRFLTKCDCGKECVVGLLRLMKKHVQTLSCGCSYDLPSFTRKYENGEKSHFLYSTWSGMKQRCYYAKSVKYKDYGGRGIKVCDDWRTNFRAFYDWAIANGASKELTLDRIDINGNYSPENCRWVDLSTQQRNRQYNRYVEYKWQKKLLIEWSEELGIRYDTIRHRLDSHGFTVGQALGFEKCYSHNNPRHIMQYDKDMNFIKEWRSRTQIATELKRGKASIKKYLDNGKIDGYGYYWRYKDDE